MTIKKITAAESELLYLKHNAVLSLMLGMVISGEMLYALLKLFAPAGWIITLVALLYTVAMLMLVIIIFKVSRYSRGSTKRAFWYGDFKDEFSAFLNYKGYKYSFFIILVMLLATWAFAGIDDFSPWAKSIVLKHYAAVLISMSLWAYALPVLMGLRAEHE